MGNRHFPLSKNTGGFPGSSVVKRRQYGSCRRPRFGPWVGKIPWRRKWQPAPVFLPGESHGQSSLAGYSPQGCTESDMTGRTHIHEHRASNQAEEWSQWEETDQSWRESIRVRTHDI